MIVAGSDSGGGAGIEADLKTTSALGVFSTCCLAAVTSQNTNGVQGIFGIPSETVGSQMESVLSDIGTNSLKTGMLGDIETIKIISEKIRKYQIENVVIDPVMVSTSGDRLLPTESVDAIKKYLIKNALIITPNIFEVYFYIFRQVYY